MAENVPAQPVSGLSQHRYAPRPEAVARVDARGLAELFITATRWGGHDVQQAVVARWEEMRDGAIEWAKATGDPGLLHALACLEMDTEIADYAATAARDLDRIETAIDLFTRAGDTARALDLEHLLAVGLDNDPVLGDELLERIRDAGDPRALITSISRSWLDLEDIDAVRVRLAELRALAVDVTSEPMTRMRMGFAILGLGPAFDSVLDLPDVIDAYLLDDEFPVLRSWQAQRRAALAQQTGQGARAVTILRAEADHQRSMGEPVELARVMHDLSDQLADLDEPGGAEQAIRAAVAAARSSGIAKYEADALHGLAVRLTNQGRFVEAVTVVDEALALLATVGEPRHLISGAELIGTHWVLCEVGARAHLELDHTARASALARAAAWDCEQLGDPGRASDMWEIIGETLISIDAAEADQAYERAVRLADAAKDGMRVFEMTRHRVWAIASFAGLEEAARMLEQVKRIAERLRDSCAANPELASSSGIDAETLALSVEIDEVRLATASTDPGIVLDQLGGLPERAAEHGDLDMAQYGFWLRAWLYLQLDKEQDGFTALSHCVRLADCSGNARMRREALSMGRDWLEDHGRHVDAARYWDDNQTPSTPPGGEP
ncbi:MAG: hypothetical protein E7Z97_02895 [Propionibacteriaceae bacterium]|nr:hypothetical protein [Propionibacteriaceae bacterium]